MRYALILLLLLFSGASLTAQQTDVKPEKGRGNLNGLVVNDLSRSERWGIGRATICLLKRGDTLAQTQTWDDGVFVIDSLEPGRYSLRISHPQYYTKRIRRIRVKSIGRTSLAKKPIVLHYNNTWNGRGNRRSGTLAIRANEKNKNALAPVDSVLVLLKTMNDSVLQAKMTDKQGNAYFSAVTGQYKVVITKPGYKLSSANVDYDENKEKTMAYTVVRVNRRTVVLLDFVLSRGKKPKEVLLVPVKED